MSVGKQLVKESALEFAKQDPGMIVYFIDEFVKVLHECEIDSLCSMLSQETIDKVKKALNEKD